MVAWSAVVGVVSLPFASPAMAAGPFLKSSVPVTRSTGVPTDAHLVLTFSESVTAEEGGLHLYAYPSNVLVETARVSDTTKVSLVNDVVTVNWAKDLAPNTTYFVRIDETAFDNLADEGFGGVNSEGTLMFTTGSGPAPTTTTTMTSTTPSTTTTLAPRSPAVLNTRCTRVGARRVVNGERLVCGRGVTRVWRRA